jgi:FkbM family methyltransferase
MYSHAVIIMIIQHHKTDTIRPNIMIEREQTCKTHHTARFFCAHRGRYGNFDDFEANKRMFRFLTEQGQNKKSSVVLVAGANRGQSMMNILKEAPDLTLHGFEIQEKEGREAARVTQHYKNAVVHSQGWGEKKEKNIPIGGSGGLAGFYDPKRQRGWTLSGEIGETVRLDTWTKENHLEQVLFVLIDTEGYEPKVIRGMGLELMENRKRFPCFQYELGGTWAREDNRHLRDKWGQFETAQYLESVGYKLFLVGADDWLPINSEFFQVEDNPIAQDEGYGPFIQGNVLALHPDFAFPPLRDFIYGEK